MNWSLLLFPLIGCIVMAILSWIKHGKNFKLGMIAGKLVFGFVMGGLAALFIDQFFTQGAMLVLATIAIIYFTYVVPGLKNL